MRACMLECIPVVVAFWSFDLGRGFLADSGALTISRFQYPSAIQSDDCTLGFDYMMFVKTMNQMGQAHPLGGFAGSRFSRADFCEFSLLAPADPATNTGHLNPSPLPRILVQPNHNTAKLTFPVWTLQLGLSAGSSGHLPKARQDVAQDSFSCCDDEMLREMLRRVAQLFALALHISNSQHKIVR